MPLARLGLARTRATRPRMSVKIALRPTPEERE
jgi:hypothetical protein